MKRWLALLVWLCCGAAQAHPLAPALLQLREGAEGRVELLWRASILQAVGVEPQLPADCVRVEEPRIDRDDRGAYTARWAVQCPGGLTGRSLSVPQLERAGINVILRVERADGSVAKTLLDGARSSYTVPAPEAAPAVFPSYLHLGVEHLLFGFDHVLFVAALVLLVRRLKPLLITVTAFTLGHSITLGLAVLGFVHVDPGLTELGIALSILLLACELARPADRPPTLLARRPALMAVSFGLLHGLGFAGALSEVGLPQGEIPLALFAFNLGIELGQVLLVVVLLALGLAWRRLPAVAQGPLPRLAPVYLIGALAAYWCLERVSGIGL